MTFDEWFAKEYGEKREQLGLVVPELMRSAFNAALESRVLAERKEPSAYDPATQWGSPEFDGAEAYEAHLEAMYPEEQDFEWPTLPGFPDPMMYSPQNGLPLFSGHQMQGYANAYGEAVRVSLTHPTPDDAARYPHAAIGAALIATGLYDRMSDITGGDREARKLIEELIATVDPVLDRWHKAAIDRARQSGEEGKS